MFVLSHDCIVFCFQATLPEFLWESFSTASLLSDFQVIDTIKMRNQGEISPEIGQRYFETCLNDINRRCQQMSIHWNVGVCQWSPETGNDKKILSNVISLLKKHEKHWAKFEKFKNVYAEKQVLLAILITIIHIIFVIRHDSAISEMMIQHSCGSIIQLLSASKSDTVRYRVSMITHAYMYMYMYMYSGISE